MQKQVDEEIIYAALARCREYNKLVLMDGGENYDFMDNTT